MSITGQVHFRVFGTALTPVGILLGVFVLSFAWLVTRMDTANPPPGSPVRVLVTTDADFREPVTLEVDSPLRLDESSPATRMIPPIRETLERLASQGNMPDSELADLRRYLGRGVPPQTLGWVIHSEMAGSFPIKITPGKLQSVRASVVFGDSAPPPGTRRFVHRRLPLRSVTIQNAVPKSDFWNANALIRRLNQNVDWPWIYLAAYLPTWLLLRRLLKLV